MHDAYQRSAFRRPKTARPSRSIRQNPIAARRPCSVSRFAYRCDRIQSQAGLIPPRWFGTRSVGAVPRILLVSSARAWLSLDRISSRKRELAGSRQGATKRRVAVTSPARRLCAWSRGCAASAWPPLPERRIEKPGSSARPALASDCASSSLSKIRQPRRQEEKRQRNCSIVLYRPAKQCDDLLVGATSHLCGAREVQPEPSKTVAGERRRASFS